MKKSVLLLLVSMVMCAAFVHGATLSSLDAASVDNTAKSLNDDKTAYITFVNNLSFAVDLYWIDFDGNRVFYATIGPVGALAQPTYITHPWLIVKAGTGGTVAQGSGQLLAAFLPVTPSPASPADGDFAMIGAPSPFTVFPTSLSFSGFSGGTADEKFVDVGRTSPGQPFTATVTGLSPWLKVSGTGPAPKQISVQVDPTGLSAGRFAGSITITAPGASPSVFTLPVTYDVAPPSPPMLLVNPVSVTLNVNPITHHGAAYLSLSNGGGGDLGPLTLTTANGQEFLLQIESIAPADCSTRDASNRPILCNVTVTSTSSGSTPGTLNGSIIVKNRQGVVLKEIPVTQQIFSPLISVLPGSYFVSSFADPTVPPPLVRIPQLKVLTLVNRSGGPVDFTAYTTVPWLTVSPATGPVGSRTTVEVNANAAGLRPGGYYGQVVVRNIRASAEQSTVQVVMEVVPSNGAVRNTLAVPVDVLIAKTQESVTFGNDYGAYGASELAEKPFSATANYQGGRPFFTVSPSAGTLSTTLRPNLMVTLSKPAPPPGVYSGEVVVQVQNCSSVVCTFYLPVVAVVPAISVSTASRLATSTCVPTRIVPVVGSPLKGFEALTAWPTELNVAVVDDCAQFDQTGIVYATFSNGDPPLFLTPVNGRWRGTWTGQTPKSNVGVRFTAISTDGTLTATTSVGGSLTANPAPVPFLSDGGVLNGASFAIGRPLSPGSFVSLFGTGLSDSTLLAPSVPLPLTLAGASVQIGGIDTPVFFASDGQLNAIVPYGLPVDRPLTVVVKRGDAVQSRATSPSPPPPLASSPTETNSASW